MTIDPNNIPESWLALLGGRDASGWLAAFVESPQTAVNDLLWDAFYFGPLNLTERGQLLAGWLDRLGNSERFAERLDARLTGWVEENWGQFNRRADSLASAWSCLCSVVEFSSKLPADSRLKKCAAALRARFAERQRFLGSFSTAPAADPLGLYLAVIAEFQGEDRSLAAFWHRLCNLPDGVPFYHARYAMLGLRRLKAADPADNGTLRAEIVLGLLRLARAFDRLAEDQTLKKPGIPEHIAKATFRRVAAQTAAAYQKSPHWSKHGLAGALELPERARQWLLNAVSPLAVAVQHEENKQREENKKTRRSPRPRRSIEPDLSWAQRARDLASRLRQGDRRCLANAEHLLDEQRRYAEATGDTYFVVRTLCQFANRVQRFKPEIALRWAKEAHRWEPDNAFTWTTLKDVLLRQRKVALALRFAWVAWKRFPDDVVARNGLAEVLKVMRRYDEAIEVYRETIARFPDNVVARTGLAEVLKVMRRYDEAEKVYCETIAHFPDDVVARNGLADTLRRSRHLDKAEVEYRQSIELGYVDVATFVGLAYLVLWKDEETSRAEALDLLAQALKFDPRDRYVLALQRDLMTESEVDPDRLMSEWDEVADAPFESSTSMVGEQETWEKEWSDESEATLQPEAERRKFPARQKATPETETAASPESEDELLNEPTAEPLPETKQPRPTVDQTKAHKTEPVAHRIDEIEPRHFTPFDPIEVAALVAEAYFYRTWAKGGDKKTARSRRRKAAELLDQAELLSEQDAQVLAERMALAVDEGNELDAYQNLMSQLESQEAAVPLLVLKARLDRERAKRDNLPLNKATFKAMLAELCAVPQQLQDLNSALMPLSHFQKGLASLALLDGAERLDNAARSFSRFRRALSHRAVEEKRQREDARDARSRQAPRFHEWLQQRTNSRFFAALTEAEEVRADDIPVIESALAQHHAEVLEVEDMFADRIVFSTL